MDAGGNSNSTIISYAFLGSVPFWHHSSVCFPNVTSFPFKGLSDGMFFKAFPQISDLVKNKRALKMK